ncbi:transmembrane protein 14C isoform X1 [Myotis lucifugus]|uniref:transmembrane protein 14C isoform X1 n=1 Tax=Myotis lucifugus TaxID=59463 RepID=UPI000CCC0EDC|nr:transmembrane protein 14C isoform X1 [Myotis lucifugus]XP_023613157.1 transmembrane protein 14C isoform X1 [Myotis lucifugus]XP_023613158.1 transmembrane protein 14C isoform X1 [Myotis lucifugus]
MQKDSGPLVPLHWIGFGYAALVASGGIIGYAKAGSVPSLAAGLLFGGLAGLGAYQLSQDPRNIWVFLVTSGTLAGIMGMRFYHSGKFMPAGLIAGASEIRIASCTYCFKASAQDCPRHVFSLVPPGMEVPSLPAWHLLTMWFADGRQTWD